MRGITLAFLEMVSDCGQPEHDMGSAPASIGEFYRWREGRPSQ